MVVVGNMVDKCVALLWAFPTLHTFDLGHVDWLKFV